MFGTVTKKGRCSPGMGEQEKLANTKKSLSSLHTFTFSFLKNQTSPRVADKENSRVEISHSDEGKMALLLANATHTQLDIHEQSESDEDEDRHLSLSSSDTNSERNIHSSSATPLLVHSELGLSASEPFPDYYESCEQNTAVVDKDIEEAYNHAIAMVFEEVVRIRKPDPSLASVSFFASRCNYPTTLLMTEKPPSQVESDISFASQSASLGDITVQGQVISEPIPASQVTSVLPGRADSDKVAAMLPAFRARTSVKNTNAYVNNATLATSFISNDVPVQGVTSRVASIPSIASPSVSSGNAGVQSRHTPSTSSSSASTISSGQSAIQAVPVGSMPHMISHTFEAKNRDDQTSRSYESGFLVSQPTHFAGLNPRRSGQTFFASLQGPLPLSESICRSQAPGRALSIDEIVTPDEPPSPNFQPPIGTGRPVPGAAPKPAANAETQCRLRETGERKLNILEEMKIILRADGMKDDIQRRFTVMTNIILRMEWILFRRDVNANGTRTNKFLSASVVEEVEELAIPMVQYLAWLDKKLQAELDISQQVLYSVIQIAKNQDLGVYQRFRQTAQVIIGNLRKPRPLEKHLLTIFQDLYDTFVYSSFLNVRNRQILHEDKPHTDRDRLARLLIAGWDVLSRAIENYSEIITINSDLKNRFVEPIMERLPHSYKIWEEEWEEHQRQTELEKLYVEAEERAQAEAQKQEIARTQAHAMAEFRAQIHALGQGFVLWHVDSRIQV
ncbi:hypothetical protein BDV23DRAFT_179680 [Aspergillus alliaceus]|uniref:Uncharacterized protein n=1 Tax=Petromyces alliaceus TaxID=209559 RepID=A0A5N7CL00_PETAA|nr:hypothetical protein BDV23DRAFT_179680 [Aspergillus alliaceus]